jgi:hypothetical protein
MEKIKLMMERIRKTKSKVLPISIETPARLFAPKIIDKIAKIKKATAARNINSSLHKGFGQNSNKLST